MTEEVLKDLQSRLSFIESRLMTPVVTRKDIKTFVFLGFAIVFLGVMMLVGELYILNQINHVYSLLE